jgi:hypothetical protein
MPRLTIVEALGVEATIVEAIIITEALGMEDIIIMATDLDKLP